MGDISDRVKNSVHYRSDMTNQLLECLVKQNEDLLQIYERKVSILDSIDKRDERVMRMYRIKNMWSGLFGLLGLVLTIISTVIMAIGVMYLPDETKALFNEIFTLMGL